MEDMVNFKQLVSFYKGKRVFITGHTGFKGSWLSSILHLAGAEIKGYALEPEYESSLFSLISPLNIINSVIDDIRDKEKLHQEIISFKPDYIFHLAAQPLVRRSYQIPGETFHVNVIGTANLLESIIKLDHKCNIMIITTDKVYENLGNYMYNEDNRLGGYDPYSASKACAELVVNSFRSSFFGHANYEFHKKNLVSARAGNVIGGGDWSEDRILPDLIRSLSSGSVINVRNPEAVRPWQHVLEPLSGYLLLGGLLDQGVGNLSDAYNFGPLPQDHLSVKDLVEYTIKIWGHGEWKDVSALDKPHEAAILKLDITRARNELGWCPKLNAYTAIEWSVDWYKQQSGVQRTDLVFQQIRQFFDYEV